MVFQTLAQLQESRKQKQRYKIFRFFPTLIGKNHCSCFSYNSLQCQTQLVQPNLLYQAPKKVEHNNSYINRNQNLHIYAENIYTLQDAQAKEFF